MGTESYGVQRITSGMVVEIRRRGIDVHVMSVHPGSIADRAAAAELPTTVFTSAIARAGWTARLRSVRILRLLAENIHTARRLRAAVIADDLDLIQLSDIELVVAARLAVRRTRTRICYLTPNRPPVHRLATWLFPRVLGGHRLTVLSNSDDIRARFADVGVTSTTLMLGIDPAEFTLGMAAPHRGNSGTVRLVTIGRLNEIKAQDLWIAATIELLDRGHDVSLMIVGGDLNQPEFVAGLHALVAASGHAERFTFAGDRNDVTAMLADADVALCGTRDVEAFGLAAVESLSCERPVVVLGDGGIRETVDDGVTGWFVPAVELSSMVDTLERCLADRPRWAEMGRAGREKVLRLYTLERVVDHYLAILATG
ncbi:MAG: pimB 2 [Ilumatobacteraceae bacterium]|nr:pimB 2 [Ilumatobacteraceae bacterium]